MKIHTSNKEKVKTILDNTTIQGSFWDYTLKYELDNSYLKFDDLIDDDYFNMPEFKWSDWLHEKYVFDVQLNTEDDRTSFFNAFDHKPTILNYIHYELDDHPLKEYEYEFTEKISPKYPIYVITKGRWEKTLTIDTLEGMGIDFNICVEPSEYDNYISNPKIDKNKVRSSSVFN